MAGDGGRPVGAGPVATDSRPWVVQHALAVGLTGGVLVGCVFLYALCGTVEGWADRWLLRCPAISVSAAGEVQAPPFCVDPTHIPLGEQAQFHKALVNYASGLPPDPAGSEWQHLQPVEGYSIQGAIYAVKGAKQLTEKDLSRRGRIVAKITASRDYEHGIRIGESYVWVDYGPFRKWRALIIPSDANAPISVLTSMKVTQHSLESTRVSLVGGVDFEPDSVRWFNSLSRAVQDLCVSNSKTACWFNTPANASAKIELFDEFDETDGWVWVTQYGCVCVGTLCHDADRARMMKR